MDNIHSMIFSTATELDTSQHVDTDTEALPLLVTRDFVLFPNVVFPVMLTRDIAVRVAEQALERNLTVGVFCQTNPEKEHPGVNTDDLMIHGVLAMIHNVMDLPDGTKTALVRSIQPLQLLGEADRQPIPDVPTARVQAEHDVVPRKSDKEFAALVSTIRDTTSRLLEGEKTPQVAVNLENVEEPCMLVNIVASYAPLPLPLKTRMLAERSIKKRAYLLLSELLRVRQMSKVVEEVKEKARGRIAEQQRNIYLQQQLEAIREELYGPEQEEISALRKKADEAKLPEKVRELFNRDVERLTRMSPQSPDYSVQLTYLETLVDLPWGVYSPLTHGIVEAETILDADHYGLEKVKERILEQLAVMIHNPEGRAPIICLVGAPGVGKTSLGKSIAEALCRQYVRISLGGMHDEAEIRGHRRTYIGAMPGRVVDAMRRAGTSNPLLLLDEIDKLGRDFRGDPSAALLEVLDPEQNHRFHDNYVDVDIDLSHVLFVCTANTLADIPRPLLDRMEVIEIPGYLPEEKLQIARRHLLPRALKQNALDKRSADLTDTGIAYVIDRYTSESGVRALEKEINNIVRKVLLARLKGTRMPRRITEEGVRKLLGVERYTRERYDIAGLTGVATGLAWTAVGGEILFIETSLSEGKDAKLTLTGNLGDVMKESAMIALQYVRAHAATLGIAPDTLEKHAIHIHVPEGAIPKDGPSAGVTMATSLVSALTGRPVRTGLAMTGELTLRGKVMAVGGIKEKVLAAKRAGATHILLPADNRRDLEDIKPGYLEGLTFLWATTLTDVLDAAFPNTVTPDDNAL